MFLFGLTLLVAGRAGVLAEGDEPLATIEVTAPPILEAESRAPTSAVSVVDTTERASEPFSTVDDAMAETAGVQVRRFGGLGAFSTLSIRGSSTNQVQMYLDGVPLSRARNETVNLANLPLQSLERIEVYRGTAPVSLGLGAIGGVVNLVTRPPSDQPASRATASYGSFDTREVAVSHTRAFHGVELLGFVDYLGSQGDFSFEDDNGTPLNPADDSRTKRKNNAFNSVEGLTRAAYTLANGLRLDLTNELFYKDQGVPGIGSNQSDSASQDDFRSLNYLRASGGLWDGAVDLSGTLFGVFESQEFDDRDGDLFGIRQDTVNETSVAGLSSTGTWIPHESNLLGASAELSYERFSPFNDLPGARVHNEPDQTRFHAGLALQDQIAPVGDFVLLVPTLRYEHFDDQRSGSLPAGQPGFGEDDQSEDLWSPSTGLQVQPIRWLSLRGNIGIFRRAPNLSELFGNQGFVRGNPKLQPEKSTNRDVGLVLASDEVPHCRNLRLEYFYFNNDADDLIVFVQNAQQYFVPTNVGSSRTRGHEVAAHGSFFEHVEIDTNYTRLDAENRSPGYEGKQLPGRPRNELYLRAQVFEPRGAVYYELNLISGNYLDQINFREVPSRDLHSLGLRLEPLAWLTLSFEARNLTDNQVSDFAGFPLPGRSFFGSVEAQL